MKVRSGKEEDRVVCVERNVTALRDSEKRSER